jgi:uncharacterized protein DUF3987
VNALAFDPLPDARTPEQQRAYDALHGDGGLASWERVVSQATPENRAAILKNALRELYRLADRAAVNHIEIGDWASHVGELYGIADVEQINEEIDATIEAAARVDEQAEQPSVVNVVSVVPWPKLDDAALHGVAGEIVRTIEPHSEADPVALLIQTLTFAGSAVGPTPHYVVESDHHHSNLNAVLVGDTSKARKGTSAGRIKAVVKAADPTWSDDRIKSGLSSGEGLINEVRDAVQRWDAKAQNFETADPGVSDKRLLVIEPEFAGALAVAERHGNTLSPIIRRAWDGDKLSTLTKNSPLTATGSHISIVGHITAQELRERITRTDAANGFANRFLFAMVRRSKELPFGGDLTDSEIQELGDRLRKSVEYARSVGRVRMTAGAQRKWAAVYPSLSTGQAGLLGAITARAEAQVVRLGLIYALLDGHAEIDESHLRAALALWEYCEASAAYVFGDSLGDPVADEIHRALQQAGPNGLTRTNLRDLFGRNKSADRIGAALQLLATRGRARPETVHTGGRPSEIWYAR